LSYTAHEAFDLDSFQDSLLFWDDFEGDSLKDLWTNTLGSGGTGAVVDAVDGGIFRLGTPTASDTSYIFWNNIRTLHVNKQLTVEARVRANGGVTDTLRLLLQLIYDDDNRIMIYHSTDSVDITILCEDDTNVTSGDSGINLDDQFHIYRIECSPTAVHFYIDGVETANSPITTNIPNDAADYIQPRFYIVTNADTDPATSMDIDYCYIRQER